MLFSEDKTADCDVDVNGLAAYAITRGEQLVGRQTL